MRARIIATEHDNSSIVFSGGICPSESLTKPLPHVVPR
jgi:hypothetical protein